MSLSDYHNVEAETASSEQRWLLNDISSPVKLIV